ncbi:MAG: hypothetical protein M3280_04290 [Actinomycetota bacterium]|nr:hypothetical protein [Actinomycetota bacterium]
MKKAGILLAVVAVVAGLSLVVVQADSAYKVTGGGQMAVGDTGPGDTIAFNAQQTGSGNAARGQVQFVDRDDDGHITRIWHGEVTCLAVVTMGDDGAARFAGNWTGRKGATSGTFEILADDNGEPNQGDDMIFIDEVDPPDCSNSQQNPDSPTSLGRGNVQIHE